MLSDCHALTDVKFDYLAKVRSAKCLVKGTFILFAINTLSVQ